MSLIVKKNSPILHSLRSKGIPVMSSDEAETQDIRPLKIGFVNLMSTVRATEEQIFSLLANTPLQIELVSIRPVHIPKSELEKRHLDTYYITFDELKEKGKLDGLIITGAAVGHKKFEDVPGWKEIVDIFNWSRNNVASTLYYCWASHAGLYHHYGINRTKLDEKTFGVFEHDVYRHTNSKLIRNMDDVIRVCQSRLNTVLREDINAIDGLSILIESAESGVHLVQAGDGEMVFMQGHPEYERYTLKQEYDRDLQKYIEEIPKHTKRIEEILAKGNSSAEEGLTLLRNFPVPPVFPKHYFPNNDANQVPIRNWRSNGQTFYTNWVSVIYGMTVGKISRSRIIRPA